MKYNDASAFNQHCKIKGVKIVWSIEVSCYTDSQKIIEDNFSSTYRRYCNLSRLYYEYVRDVYFETNVNTVYS